MQATIAALAGVNFGLILGIALLGGMALTHLARGLRFDPRSERIALAFFCVMCLCSVVERLFAALVIVLGGNAVVMVTLVCRISLGVTVWACAFWVFFAFWPSQPRRK